MRDARKRSGTALPALAGACAAVLLCAIGSAAMAVAPSSAMTHRPGTQEVRKVIDVWPGLAPGATKYEVGRTDASVTNVHAVTDVSRPQLHMFALPGRTRRPAVIVCPGGGYNILADEHEGTEIAAWLNGLGYHAAVLHYRVPGRGPAPLQDLQRALSLLRSQSAKWSIDSACIGVLGFSAGAHLCARLGASHATRAYDRIDTIDNTSCRPDFELLIYPAYLTDGPKGPVTSEVGPDADTPPVFLMQTRDDRVFSAPGYAAALDTVGIPNRCVLYETGGHGYGLRIGGDLPLHRWPQEAEDFLRWVTVSRPRTHLLWPDGAPHALGGGQADRPTYTVHYPPRGKRTRAAVVVCPGGGYHALMMSYEGHDIARWLNGLGITAIVLRYRVKPYAPTESIADGVRAVRLARTRARELGIDPKRIGMMGFSAGGHLASSVGTRFDAGNRRAPDPVERRSSRPDFLVLVYPSTTIGGGTPTHEQVRADAPPAFVVHASTDQVVPVDESRSLVAAMRAQNVPVEYLELPSGAHGLGCGTGDLWERWQAACADWLAKQGLARP